MTPNEIIKTRQYARALRQGRFNIQNRMAVYRIAELPEELFHFIGKSDTAQFNLAELALAVAWIEDWVENKRLSERNQ